MKNISPKEVFEMLKKTNTLLVDVRTDAEVAELSIPKALHIPLDELSTRLCEIPVNSTVMFHCRSGGRSTQAALFAEKSGYKNAHSVAGGITEWVASGLPTVHALGE